MPVAILSPATVTVGTVNTFDPASIVGGDTSLGDNSDATYGEAWVTWISPDLPGDLVVAQFPALAASRINSLSIIARVELFNSGSASTQRFEVGFFDNADIHQWIADTTTAEVEFGSSVPAAGTIYDLPATAWTFAGVAGDIRALPSIPESLEAARVALVAGRLEVDIGRLTEATPVSPSHYGIRVYELSLVVDYATNAQSTMRKHPNPTGLGVGPARHWPRPRRGISGIR